MAEKSLTAADVMTTRVACISPGANVRLAAELMLKRKVSALMVVDAKRRLVGICSEGDLVHRAELGSRKKGSWWLNLIVRDRELARDYARAHGRRVSDAMSRNVVAVTPSTQIPAIAGLMDKHKIKRVPVLDGGKVVGVVSRADILAAFVRATSATLPGRMLDDGAILAEIRKRLDKERWGGAALVGIAVESGVVKYSGIVASLAQRDALHALAESVEGVRHVDDKGLHVDVAAVSMMHSLPIPGLRPKPR